MNLPQNKKAKSGRAFPKALIVWQADTSEAAPLLHMLETDYQLQAEPSLEKVQAAAQRTPDAQILLFHCPPACEVRLALASGRQPEAALETWRANAQTLVKLLRQLRGRTTLIDPRQAIENTSAFAEFFQLGAKQTAASVPPLTPGEQALALFATQLVQAATSDRMLAAEIEAFAHDLSGTAAETKIDLTAAYEFYLAAAGKAEDARQETQATEARLTTRLNHAKSMTQTVAAVSQARERQLQTALAEAEDRARAHEAEIERMLSSKSFRLTAPLRAVTARLASLRATGNA